MKITNAGEVFDVMWFFDVFRSIRQNRKKQLNENQTGNKPLDQRVWLIRLIYFQETFCFNILVTLYYDLQYCLVYKISLA